MSDVNWRLLIRRRDHTFQAPVPEMTATFGVPNACNTCHDDRTPEWAAIKMDQWWGDGERRKEALLVADTMYRAGSGDATVLPALSRLAVDRSQSLLIRASAVEFMGQLALGTAGVSYGDAQSQTSFARPQASGPRPQQESVSGLQAGYGTQGQSPALRRQPVTLNAAQVNALIGAAADPEAIVRAQAVTAMLAAGTRDRIVPPLTARLVDAARVVRVRAAEALLALGIVHLPGPAGRALARAQDEYLVSLRDFPDVASNQTAIGWLEAERDHLDAARQALDAAIQLDPRAARPVVIKGVIAARESKFAEAVDLWRIAKSLDPVYPNIDQLILEAQKRKAAGR
jgi:hypothetical protein